MKLNHVPTRHIPDPPSFRLPSTQAQPPMRGGAALEAPLPPTRPPVALPALEKPRNAAASEEQTWAKVHSIAAHMGIIGALAHQRMALRRPGGMLGQLLDEAVLDAHASSRPGRKLTAFRKLQTFCLACDIEVPFVPCLGLNAPVQACKRYNQSTLDGFQQWLRKTTELAASTIQDYTSAIKTYCEIEAGGAITTDPPANIISTNANKQRRKNAPAVSPRALQIGVGGADFNKIWKALDLDNKPINHPDFIEFDAAVVAYEYALRGGEVGLVDGPTELDSSRDFCGGSVQLRKPSHGAVGHPWLWAAHTPIKDAHAKFKAIPLATICKCSVNKRRVACCGYCAVTRTLRRRFPGAQYDKDGYLVSKKDRAELLFRRPDGKPVRTQDVARIARRFARLAGLDERYAGGKSFRIKSATDLLRPGALGMESKHILKRRGRWGSDIFFVYARVTHMESLIASAALGGPSLTVERPGGWVQPGR